MELSIIEVECWISLVNGIVTDDMNNKKSKEKLLKFLYDEIMVLEDGLVAREILRKDRDTHKRQFRI